MSHINENKISIQSKEIISLTASWNHQLENGFFEIEPDNPISFPLKVEITDEEIKAFMNSTTFS